MTRNHYTICYEGEVNAYEIIAEHLPLAINKNLRLTDKQSAAFKKALKEINTEFLFSNKRNTGLSEKRKLTANQIVFSNPKTDNIRFKDARRGFRTDDEKLKGINIGGWKGLYMQDSIKTSKNKKAISNKSFPYVWINTKYGIQDNLLTMLHELAHHIDKYMNKGKDHGRDFKATLILLWNHFLGNAAAAWLYQSYLKNKNQVGIKSNSRLAGKWGVLKPQLENVMKRLPAVCSCGKSAEKLNGVNFLGAERKCKKCAEFRIRQLAKRNPTMCSTTSCYTDLKNGGRIVISNNEAIEFCEECFSDSDFMERIRSY